MAEWEKKLNGVRPEDLVKELDKLKKALADKDRENERLLKRIAELEALVE